MPLVGWDQPLLAIPKFLDTSWKCLGIMTEEAGFHLLGGWGDSPYTSQKFAHPQ